MNVDPTYSPPAADIERLRSRALIAGVVGLAGCGLGLLIDRDHFFRAWLVAYLLFLGIALGSMALIMIQHLSGGAWGVFRRIFEASSRTLPLLAVLFIPVLLGVGTLYPWSHADHVATDEVLRHKSAYLNTPFFLVRSAAYFALWILGFLLLRRGDDAARRRLSGPGLLVYAFTLSFAAVDWAMSIEPHWSSSIYGLLFIAERTVPTGLASLIIASVPLIVVVLRIAGGDRPPPLAIAGVVVGFVGVAVLFRPTGDATWLGIGLTGISALAWAVGSYLSSRLPLPRDAFVATTFEMLAGGLILLPVGLAQQPDPTTFSGASLAAFARALATVGLPGTDIMTFWKTITPILGVYGPLPSARFANACV